MALLAIGTWNRVVSSLSTTLTTLKSNIDVSGFTGLGKSVNVGNLLASGKALVYAQPYNVTGGALIAAGTCVSAAQVYRYRWLSKLPATIAEKQTAAHTLQGTLIGDDRVVKDVTTKKDGVDVTTHHLNKNATEVVAALSAADLTTPLNGLPTFELRSLKRAVDKSIADLRRCAQHQIEGSDVALAQVRSELRESLRPVYQQVTTIMGDKDKTLAERDVAFNLWTTLTDRVFGKDGVDPLAQLNARQLSDLAAEISRQLRILAGTDNLDDLSVMSDLTADLNELDGAAKKVPDDMKAFLGDPADGNSPLGKVATYLDSLRTELAKPLAVPAQSTDPAIVRGAGFVEIRNKLTERLKADSFKAEGLIELGFDGLMAILDADPAKALPAAATADEKLAARLNNPNTGIFTLVEQYNLLKNTTSDAELKADPAVREELAETQASLKDHKDKREAVIAKILKDLKTAQTELQTLCIPSPSIDALVKMASDPEKMPFIQTDQLFDEAVEARKSDLAGFNSSQAVRESVSALVVPTQVEPDNNIMNKLAEIPNKATAASERLQPVVDATDNSKLKADDPTVMAAAHLGSQLQALDAALTRVNTDGETSKKNLEKYKYALQWAPAAIGMIGGLLAIGLPYAKPGISSLYASIQHRFFQPLNAVAKVG